MIKQSYWSFRLVKGEMGVSTHGVNMVEGGGDSACSTYYRCMTHGHR